MNHLAFIARGLLLWCCLVGAACAAGISMPAYHREVLPNGTVLLLMERHDVPLITFQATLRGGALDEAPEKAGTANLLAELLLKGAGSRNAAQFAEAMESVGGSMRAGAGIESLTVEGEFLSRDRQLMIELLADVLQRPRMDAAEFERLRMRQIEFIRAAKDSALNQLLPVYAAAALYGSHPYGHVVQGSEATLASLKLDDAQRYHREQIGGDRLVLAIAGDFKIKELRPLLRRHFTQWRRANAPQGVVQTTSPVTARRVVLVDAPQAVQSYFWIGNVGIARNDPQRVAMDLANTVYGGSFSAMLNSELRIRSGLTYGAYSRFSRPTQPGSWAITSFTRTATTIEAVDLALQTLQTLHDQGFREEKIRSGKNYVTGQFTSAYETAAQWADALTELEFYRLPREEITTYLDKLEALTSQQLREVVAAKFPTSDRALLVVIGNASELRETLSKYGPVSEMPLSDTKFSLPQAE